MPLVERFDVVYLDDVLFVYLVVVYRSVSRAKALRRGLRYVLLVVVRVVRVVLVDGDNDRIFRILDLRLDLGRELALPVEICDKRLARHASHVRVVVLEVVVYCVLDVARDAVLVNVYEAKCVFPLVWVEELSNVEKLLPVEGYRDVPEVCKHSSEESYGLVLRPVLQAMVFLSVLCNCISNGIANELLIALFLYISLFV